MSNQDLFNRTNWAINGSSRKGKVLAVANYFDRNMVCFQIEGENTGRWLPELFVNSDVRRSEVDQPILTPNITTVSLTTLTPNTPESIPPIPVENTNILAKNIETTTTQIPVAEASIDSTSKAEIKQEAQKAEIKQEAQSAVNALVKYVDDTAKAVHNKVADDIQNFSQMWSNAAEFFNSSITETRKLTNELLQDIFNKAKILVDISNEIKKIILELWNDHWRDRVYSCITGEKPNLEKIKSVVTKKKNKYPNYSNREIADGLVGEKALFATMTGLAETIPGAKLVKKVIKLANRVNISSPKLDVLNVPHFMVEMTHQIAFVYGFNEVTESELLSFTLLAFSSQLLVKFGIEFLQEHEIVPDFGVKAVTNMMLLLIYGWTVIEFYENRAKNIDLLNSLTDFDNWKKGAVNYADDIKGKEQVIEAELLESIKITEEIPEAIEIPQAVAS